MISNILDVSSTVLFVVAFYQVFDVTCPFSVLALSLVYADRSVFFISIPSRRGLLVQVAFDWRLRRGQVVSPAAAVQR
eukprot:COSAG02_NODE_4470_length_5330_cov_25.203785_1_plen_78_part_00